MCLAPILMCSGTDSVLCHMADMSAVSCLRCHKPHMPVVPHSRHVSSVMSIPLNVALELDWDYAGIVIVVS